MGKLALLLVAAAALAGVYGSSASGRGPLQASAREADTAYRVLARSAAHAGFVRAQRHLLDAFTDVTLSGRFDGVPYTTVVTVSDSVAVIVSAATARAPRGAGDGRAEVRARLRQVSGPGRLPAFLRYGLVTGEFIDFRGNTEAAAVFGRAPGDTTNVNVHTNGYLSINRNTAVRGYGSYTGSASVPDAERSFLPYAPIAGQPLVRQAPAVPLPPIVPADILAAHGGRHTTLSASRIAGPLPGGTSTRPRVYHLTNTSGTTLENVTVDGYAVFVAEGPLSFQGRVASAHDLDGRSASSALAFYTQRSVSLGSGAEAWGQFYTGGGFSESGQGALVGSFATPAGFVQSGGVQLRQRRATVGLALGVGASLDEALALVAYAER